MNRRDLIKTAVITAAVAICPLSSVLATPVPVPVVAKHPLHPDYINLTPEWDDTPNLFGLLSRLFDNSLQVAFLPDEFKSKVLEICDLNASGKLGVPLEMVSPKFNHESLKEDALRYVDIQTTRPIIRCNLHLFDNLAYVKAFPSVIRRFALHNILRFTYEDSLEYIRAKLQITRVIETIQKS